jgi:hypothetical protein
VIAIKHFYENPKAKFAKSLSGKQAPRPHERGRKRETAFF